MHIQERLIRVEGAFGAGEMSPTGNTAARPPGNYGSNAGNASDSDSRQAEVGSNTSASSGAAARGISNGHAASGASTIGRGQSSQSETLGHVGAWTEEPAPNPANL